MSATNLIADLQSISVYTASTCQYSNSTGVDRLKIVIITVTRPLVLSIASTSPSKFSKFPSLTFTRSPLAKAIFNFGGLLALFFLFGDDPLDLVRQHGRGHRPEAPGEIADPRRFADQEPGVLVDLHVDDEVAGIKLPLDHPLLAALEFRDLLRGDDDVAEKSIQAGNRHPPQQAFADRLLAVALHLEDVPIHVLRLRLLDRRRGSGSTSLRRADRLDRRLGAAGPPAASTAAPRPPAASTAVASSQGCRRGDFRRRRTAITGSRRELPDRRRRRSSRRRLRPPGRRLRAAGAASVMPAEPERQACGRRPGCPVRCRLRPAQDGFGQVVQHVNRIVWLTARSATYTTPKAWKNHSQNTSKAPADSAKAKIVTSTTTDARNNSPREGQETLFISASTAMRKSANAGKLTIR